jgi:hypothetical protein
MRLAIKKLARASTIAAAMVASSATLGASTQPLFATLGEVAFSLANVFSEVEEARRKIAEGLVMAMLERGPSMARGR